MITVKIIYLDGTSDIKDCLDVTDICLDGVQEVITIRDEKAA